MRRSLAFLAVLALGNASYAEIYQWTDAQGRVHFTQELSEVPPGQRVDALDRALERGPSQPERTSAPQPIAPASRQAIAVGDLDTVAEDRVYRVPVKRAGTAMIVSVRLNGQVTAPFVVDTGASDVAIPRAVAAELGLLGSAPTRTRRYVTANGVVEQPVVMLDSVDLAGARVEGVPASINSTMSVGLLGLSYFNHFNYRVDASEGLITMVPNNLAAQGRIRGGRSEAQWRSEFAGLRGRIEEVKAESGRTASSKSRKLRELDEKKADLERQVAELETEADTARVPASWRY